MDTPTPARPFRPTIDSASATSSHPSLPHLQSLEDNHKSFPMFDIQPSFQIPPSRSEPEINDSSLPKSSLFMSTVNFPPLPFTFGRFTRNGQKRTQSYISSPSDPSPSTQLQVSNTDNSVSVSRLQSFNDHERRESAQRNAQQALHGVMAGTSLQDYGWPAAVSREMVRLSLRQPAVEQERTQKTIGEARNPYAHLSATAPGQYKKFGKSRFT